MGLSMKKEHRVLGFTIFLFGVFFLIYKDILQASPHFIEAYNNDLASQEVVFSHPTVYWALWYTGFQIIVGWIFDRVSFRFVIPTIVLICGVAGALYAWDFPVLSRIFIGLSIPFGFVGVLILAMYWFPPRYFAFLAGMVQLIVIVGILFGGALLSSLMRAGHSSEGMMLILGAIGVICAFIGFFLIRENPLNAFKPSTSYSKQLKNLLSSKQTWLLVVYGFCGWGPAIIFAGEWGVGFLQERYGMTVSSASNYLTLFWVGVAFFGPILGWLSEQMGKRCPLLWFMAALGCVSSLALLFVPGTTTLSAGILLFGVGIAASGQVLTFAVIKEQTPQQSGGFALGIVNFGVALGGVTARLIATFIREYGHFSYRLAFVIIPILYLIAFLISFFVIKETYCTQKYEDEA